MTTNETKDLEMREILALFCETDITGIRQGWRGFVLYEISSGLENGNEYCIHPEAEISKQFNGSLQHYKNELAGDMPEYLIQYVDWEKWANDHRIYNNRGWFLSTDNTEHICKYNENYYHIFKVSGGGSWDSTNPGEEIDWGSPYDPKKIIQHSLIKR